MQGERDPQELLAELRTAMALTTERTTAQGVAWCPPRVAERLTHQVLSLGKDLPGLARQAARLARAMERAGGRMGYAGFLYRLPVLRVSSLTDRLSRAAAEGRLRAIARIEGDALVFDEPGMNAPSGRRFTLSLTALPGIAAWLDMAQNMLGFAEVARLMAPVLGETCPEGAANSVGQALARAVDGWVRTRVESQHAMKQARAIHRFLAPSPQAPRREINDAAILDFWLEHGAIPNPPVDGIVRFRSAARLMLAFRRAQRLAAEERAILGATGQVVGPEGDGLDLLETAEQGIEYGRFRSPIGELLRPPANRVNWFVNTKLAVLHPWLGTATDDTEDRASLFSGDPPNPDFARTVLRVVVFDPEQTKHSRATLTSEAGKKGKGPATYADYTRALVALADNLFETAAVTAVRLQDAARPEVLSLLDVLDPAAEGAFLARLLGQLRGGAMAPERLAFDLDDLATLLVASGLDESALERLAGDRVALQDLPLSRELQALMRRAERSQRRAGFNSKDQQDPDIIEALASGAAAISALVVWARRVVQSVCALEIDRLHAEDRALFHDAFSRRYGGDSRTA